MQLVHVFATAGVSSHRGSGGALRAVAGNGFLHRQAITSLKPEGSATSCTASRVPGDDADSCLASSACWHSSALWH